MKDKQKAEACLEYILDFFTNSDDFIFPFRTVFSSLLTTMIACGIDKKTTVDIIRFHLDAIPNDHWEDMNEALDKSKVKHGKT